MPSSASGTRNGLSAITVSSSWAEAMPRPAPQLVIVDANLSLKQVGHRNIASDSAYRVLVEGPPFAGRAEWSMKLADLGPEIG
jgi:hypothetical protein